MNRRSSIQPHIYFYAIIYLAPTTLQTYNTREFSNKILENLKYVWPGLKFVHTSKVIVKVKAVLKKHIKMLRTLEYWCKQRKILSEVKDWNSFN